MVHAVGNLASSGKAAMERRGLTLAEVMVTVAIIGIVAAATVSNFGVAVQRARWDAAQNILLTIYAGEQVYYALNNAATPASQRYYPPGTFIDVSTPMSSWRSNIYCDNPNDPTVPIPPDRVRYRVDANAASPATFTATASYFRGGALVGTLTVNQNRVLTPTPPACAVGQWCRP